jgi:polyhydroxyalkanoate synthase subunit PhaC
MSEASPGAASAAQRVEEFTRRLNRGLAALADVGEVDIGSTAKDAVFSEDKLVLYRYRPLPDVPENERVRTPVLICYALVNRPYMMDLQPDRSLIRGLLLRGVDVYLIDWGYPDGADRYLDLEDYVLRYLAHCVDFLRGASGHERINLLGVCQGGSLSLCYAALQPERLRNLITMVTPVDFHTPENLLTKWSRGVDVDALVQTAGNVPGEMLNALFLSLMPFRLNSQKYVDLLDQPATAPASPQRTAALENFLRMEKWIFDSPDQAGEMFRQFLTHLVKENGLAKGTLRLAGRSVDLKQVSMPVLNIYAMQDHVVPPSASMPLRGLVGTSDYSAYEFQGGHIGIYVSGAAQREIPQRIAEWLRQRDGSPQ